METLSHHPLSKGCATSFVYYFKTQNSSWNGKVMIITTTTEPSFSY
jgi:hypothetical protein